ncbi:MAG TPA: patatin-like phospholipase family protein [Steroidobacter sp.]|uniref:patatin-like phospholipase family protein n=1 Tax=Steroidobacter sp. TaxID=1978227 RepID=UPI002ED954D0
MSFEQDYSAAEAEEVRDCDWLARTLPLFDGLDSSLLTALLEEFDWLAIQGGSTLFEAGDAPDAVYCVISGSLGAFASTDGRTRRLVGRIAAGELVGEMALISGKPRSATVIALRDSELGRLSRAAFERVMQQHPEGLLRVAQLLVQRLEMSQTPGRTQRSMPRTFAIVPHDGSDSGTVFAAKLVTFLDHIGSCELVWNHRGAQRTTEWFHAVERANEFVVYVCDAAASSWSKLCLRQADVILLLADVESQTSDWPALQGYLDRNLTGQRPELVLLHKSPTVTGQTQRWLDLKPGLPHHHIRGPADIARLARSLTGTGLGVVLSGGGARGFAHIGVLRAFREAGIVIDSIGGTSLGSIVAAGHALEWSQEELQERVRRSFVATNPVNDYTLPLVSLVSGRKVSRLLHDEFGDVAIEDLPLPYFCVSTNLSSGQLAVHRRGTLWRWLRASVSIPGVLPPVIDRGEVFVDGATINNLPVDVMRESGVGRVIGVDVAADRVFTTDCVDSDAPPLWRVLKWFRDRKQRINILQILWRSGMVNSTANTAARRELSDLLLQPPLEQIDMLNWRAFDRAIEAGYRYAQVRLRDWK